MVGWSRVIYLASMPRGIEPPASQHIIYRPEAEGVPEVHFWMPKVKCDDPVPCLSGTTLQLNTIIGIRRSLGPKCRLADGYHVWGKISIGFSQRGLHVGLICP